MDIEFIMVNLIFGVIVFIASRRSSRPQKSAAAEAHYVSTLSEMIITVYLSKVWRVSNERNNNLIALKVLLLIGIIWIDILFYNESQCNICKRLTEYPFK